MSEFGRRLYGDPCRECGFSWSIDRRDAMRLVADLPDELDERLADATGTERHPDLGWTVTGYLAHVGDNLRIWAERVVAIVEGGSPLVTSYDEDALAEVRVYSALGLGGVRWSLRRAVADWLEALGRAPDELRMVHPDRGDLDLDEVVRLTAHDAWHHRWDVLRSI